jgi:hypothetical protein
MMAAYLCRNINCLLSGVERMEQETQDNVTSGRASSVLYTTPGQFATFAICGSRAYIMSALNFLVMLILNLHVLDVSNIFWDKDINIFDVSNRQEFRCVQNGK